MRPRALLPSLITVVGIALATACGDDDPADLDGSSALTISITGSVSDAPLTLGSQTYIARTAAEGFRPSRVSFYLSSVRLLDATGSAMPLADVAYVELDPAGSARLTFDDVIDGDYTALAFTVGLTPEQDARTPADYANDEPLGRESEYWVDWGSYIFLKLEGRSDTLADGRERFDAAYTYHVGKSAELARAVTIETPLSVGPSGTTVPLVLDLADLLDLGQSDELSLSGVADHRNDAAEQIMSNVAASFGVPN